MLQNTNKVFDIGLTGHKKTADWDLIQHLKSWHHITMVKREHRFLDKAWLRGNSTSWFTQDSPIAIKIIISAIRRIEVKIPIIL